MANEIDPIDDDIEEAGQTNEEAAIDEADDEELEDIEDDEAKDEGGTEP